MLSLPPPLRALLLCALFTPSLAIPARHLFERKDTCSAKSLGFCPADLPDNFCCPSGTTCIPLAGFTTALCCPDGLTCKKIQPIICDITYQDADANIAGAVKTTALRSTLPKCGSRCCPFGYSCNDADECVMDEDQSKSPPDASPSEPATATASTPAKTGDPSDLVPIPAGGEGEGDRPFPTTAVVLGVIGGVLAVVAVGLFFLLWRRRKGKSEREIPAAAAAKSSPRHSEASSSFGNTISDPILDPGTIRTDFIRKPESAKSHGTQRQPHSPYRAGPPSQMMAQMSPVSVGPPLSMGSMRGGQSPSPPSSRGSTRVSPIRGMNPQAPRHHQRDVSIDVFAAPGTVGVPGEGRRNTTVSQFLDSLESVQRSSPSPRRGQR
ncbi:uncharacterized protein DNG_03621 [Cephalotrichum gorgonifer]|uniref:Uncharacterized protein n=1 Tax=Cephalotrichum gorgonifer TaxID=2041049 RepID=A0AAE8MVE7_9PEZI|nr:uncharacterized protein DNG_03621 [Cephalotrichum gorgonifer]